ncbi:hypothetical protein Pst134EA_009722 [Puccinia striiformis f. sp. tritici]|uniref:hypothetical protein n=1 Tax=Puccinia striiformis f. sp. tritici TaxID=168172 RepID=UPI0020078030|nr:hypothetical protein Pst134EA_009722 [Puccinia striiformis f. sp. tritici]KAH9469193.1 hypothetical protein Pst134EA_009722 [Puccinia striiformis f. sp. tritici]
MQEKHIPIHCQLLSHQKNLEKTWPSAPATREVDEIIGQSPVTEDPEVPDSIEDYEKVEQNFFRESKVHAKELKEALKSIAGMNQCDFFDPIKEFAPSGQRIDHNDWINWLYEEVEYSNVDHNAGAGDEEEADEVVEVEQQWFPFKNKMVRTY